MTDNRRVHSCANAWGPPASTPKIACKRPSLECCKRSSGMPLRWLRALCVSRLACFWRKSASHMDVAVGGPGSLVGRRSPHFSFCRGGATSMQQLAAAMLECGTDFSHHICCCTSPSLLPRCRVCNDRFHLISSLAPFPPLLIFVVFSPLSLALPCPPPPALPSCLISWRSSWISATMTSSRRPSTSRARSPSGAAVARRAAVAEGARPPRQNARRLTGLPAGRIRTGTP